MLESLLRTGGRTVCASLIAAVGVSPLVLPAPALAQTPFEWVELDPEYTLYIDLPSGRVVVELSKGFAPNHVEQVQRLVREGHYEGYSFMRVVEGFLAQAGEPTNSKEIRTGRASLPAEFETEWSEQFRYTPIGGRDEFGEESGIVNGFPVRRDPEAGRIWITRCPGIMGFGRDDDPNTGRASFWIALQNIRGNDRNDTVFGRVVWGMDHISRLPRTGDGFENAEQWTPIESMSIAADLPAAERLQLEVVDTNHPSFRQEVEAAREGSNAWFAHRPLRLDLCQTVIPARLMDQG